MKVIHYYWSNLSIRFKLLIYFCFIIFFVSLLNVYLNNNNYRMMDQFNETMSNYYKIDELRIKTQENRDYIADYIRSLDEEDRAMFRSTQEEILESIDELYGQFLSKDAYFSLNAISNSVQSYNKLWNQAIDERKNNVPTYYEAYYSGGKIYDYTDVYIQELFYISLSEGTALYNKLTQEAGIMRQISNILIIGVLALSMFFGAVFSNQLVKPIKELAVAAIEMADGNLNVKSVEVRAMDEVGILAESFNAMSSSIKNYVEDLKQKVVVEKKLHEEEMAIIRMEQLLQDAEFQALQSQINPHFLFNTLNTISRTAMFEEADDTVKLIQALSNLFRYRIKNSGDTVSLKEELWLVEEYIYLQKMRFKGRLDFSVKSYGDTESITIPVFTLQPIIENAIIHGIEPKIHGGKLRIRVQIREDKTVITITDTGVGIEPNQLNRLINKKRIKEASHIGVANVYCRFKLYFEEQGHFKMYSRLGEGTVVKLTIDTEVNHV